MSILENIIAQMEGEAVTTQKTAAVAAPAPTSAEERMLATVRNLTAKTASAQPQTSAVDALQKIAHETAAMEEEVMLKQAEFAGAAMCDGFMARFAQYDGAVGGATKTASAADMQKIAEEAYAQGVADLEKQASDAYAQGYQAQIQEIHKIASEIHVAGQQSARNVLQALSKTASEDARRLPFGHEKTAARPRPGAATIQEVEQALASVTSPHIRKATPTRLVGPVEDKRMAELGMFPVTYVSKAPTTPEGRSMLEHAWSVEDRGPAGFHPVSYYRDAEGGKYLPHTLEPAPAIQFPSRKR